MNIISIDASTTCCGWSIFDGDNLVAYGKVKPPEKTSDWRERLRGIIPQLNDIVLKYKPVHAYCEDVPLFDKKGKKTLVELGGTQGMILSLFATHKIDIDFIQVSTWRSNIGLYDGTNNGKKRDLMKIKSIRKANELFNLDLACVFTKGGNYDSKKSDDDISDSILVYCSTRDKYRYHGILD